MRQFLRFALMTGLSACLTVGLPILLHELLGLIEEISVAIALVTAFFVNFFTLRHVVFCSTGKPRTELFLFLGASIAFRVSEYGSFIILFSFFHINYALALGIILFVSVILKFFLYRFVIFNPAVTGHSVVSDASASRWR